MSVLEFARLSWNIVLTVKRTSTQHDHENVLIVLLDTQSVSTFSHTQRDSKVYSRTLISTWIIERNKQKDTEHTTRQHNWDRDCDVTCVLTWILKLCLYTNTWCKHVWKWMHNWINMNREFNANTVWTISDLWCFLVTVDTIDRYWLVQCSLVQTRP